MGVAMVHGQRQFFTFGPWSHPHIVMWSLWSVGNEEHFLSSGDHRGSLFTRQGYRRGRLRGYLIQGVIWVDTFRTRNSLLLSVIFDLFNIWG